LAAAGLETNMGNVSREIVEKQDRFFCSLSPDKNPTELAEADRKLLLEVGLSYNLRKIRHNYPVCAGDLLALLPFTSRQSEELEAA
jgi:hypothetical protein